MRIEDSYAKNVVGSPAFVEDFDAQEEDYKQLVEAFAWADRTLDLETMLVATEQGLSRRETVCMLEGVTYIQVCRACNQFKNQGVKLRAEKTGVQTDTKEKAKVLLEQNLLSVKEIGKELGVSPQMIYKIKKGLTL
jgi:transposase